MCHVFFKGAVQLNVESVEFLRRGNNSYVLSFVHTCKCTRLLAMHLNSVASFGIFCI